MTATSSNRRLTVEAKGDPETVEEQRKIIYEWSEQQKNIKDFVNHTKDFWYIHSN